MSTPTENPTTEFLICRDPACDVGWRFDPWRRDIVLLERLEHEWDEHRFVAD